MDTTIIKKIEEFIVDSLVSSQVPGLSIGIIEDGDLVYAKGFGRRNLEENLPMDENTLYGIGSVSKSFTALAILQLVGQGKINLDDPITKYIDLRLSTVEDPITIHHALSHSSGVPALNGSTDPLVNLDGNYQRIVPVGDPKDLLLHLNKGKAYVKFKPGTHYFYNNDLYACLDLVIRNVTGLTLAEYAKKNIFEPLEMRRTTYSKADFENDPLQNKIVGYSRHPETNMLKATPFPFSQLIHGAGGIISSIHEMGNYVKMLMNGGNFKGTQIVDKELIDILWTPRTSLGSENPKDPHYCYGWVKTEILGETLIHHNGSILVSSADCVLVPDKKIGILIGENYGGGSVSGLAILAMLLNENPAKALPIIGAQQKVAPFLGTYVGYRDVVSMKVFIKDGALTATSILGKKELTTAPLVVKDLDALEFYFPSLVAHRAQDILKFYVEDKTGDKYLTQERNLLIKQP